jgi:dolichyl-phosphate beta-glucosyltransferase
MNDPHVAWVVPCFDEEHRLKGSAFLAMLDEMAPASLLFVDDGSRDQTLALLRTLAEKRSTNVDVISLPQNLGKGEAVRQGLLHALSGPADIVGYVDADLATPPVELGRLSNLARSGNYDILIGSRVQLLGRSITRNSVRHYFGRIFATCASLCLDLPIYDTQCGAKLFRRTVALSAALAEPFASRWAFDVELLARLVYPQAEITPIAIDRIREEPLLVWTDVSGSKLHPAAAVRSGLELVRIGWKVRHR